MTEKLHAPHTAVGAGDVRLHPHEAPGPVREANRHCTSKQMKIYTSKLRSGLIREAEKLGWSTKASLIPKVPSREEMGPGCKGAPWG